MVLEKILCKKDIDEQDEELRERVAPRTEQDEMPHDAPFYLPPYKEILKDYNSHA